MQNDSWTKITHLTGFVKFRLRNDVDEVKNHYRPSVVDNTVLQMVWADF